MSQHPNGVESAFGDSRRNTQTRAAIVRESISEISEVKRDRSAVTSAPRVRPIRTSGDTLGHHRDRKVIWIRNATRATGDHGRGTQKCRVCLLANNGERWTQ